MNTFPLFTFSFWTQTPLQKEKVNRKRKTRLASSYCFWQAKANCFFTHKNSEAIKAAQAVATAVFFARNRKSKDEIRSFLENKFHYNLSKNLDEIRNNYVFDSRASYSVPPAIIAFLDSTDYESAIRNAVSLSGDADTEACIAGGIAEAYYKEIPKHISDFCGRKIDYTLKKVVLDFKDKYCEIL